MAADGSIIIDTRVNNKGAEADLKALQAKAKSTAQQISALDKQITQATGKRTKLADDLAKAKAEAQATETALQGVNSQLEAAKSAAAAQVRQEYPGMSDANVNSIATSRALGSNASLVEESDKLTAVLDKQTATVSEIEAEYRKQADAVDQLQQQHSNLQQQLEQEQAAAQQASIAYEKAIASQQRAKQFQSADSSMQDYFSKQISAVEKQYTKIENRQNKVFGGQNADGYVEHAEQVVLETQREVAALDKATNAAKQHAQQEVFSPDSGTQAQQVTQLLDRAANACQSFGSAISGKAIYAGNKMLGRISDRLKTASKNVQQFKSRLLGIVSGALLFNVISSGLSKMTAYMGEAVTSSNVLRTALGNLQGAALTAAAPLLQNLAPALAALANMAATLFSYLAKLIALLTGTTVSAATSAAKGIAGIGSAASGTSDEVKKATKSLAGFDEITRLDAPDSDSGGGGGGGSGSITPNFDFSGKSPFLDDILSSIEQGQWFQVGRLIGEKLRDSLNAIPWPDIQAKAVQWATNIATTINGAVTTPGLWEAIGHTLAQGLNTITAFADTFFQGVWWTDIGAGLARGLTQLVSEVNWEQLGRVLTDGLRAALLTLHGFVTTYTGWADLGTSIAAMIGAALTNIDWVQAAGDLSQLAIGILTAINAGLEQADWGTVGNTLLGMLLAIDWLGLFNQLGQLFANTWPLILTAVVLPAILSWVSSALIPAVITGVGSVLSAIVAAIGAWPVALIAATVVVFGLLLKAIVDNWDAICDWFSGAWDSFVAGWNDFWSLVAANAQNWWDDVRTGWTEFWDGVASAFDTLKASLSQAWNSFWSGLATSVASIWEGIVSTVKGAVNSLIGLVNGMISAIVGGLNGAIDVLNNLSIDTPDWLPLGMGGQHLGFNISHITAPQIPYLAQGAVIPPNREFMAVLGDQSHGTNVEAPLATIQEAVAAVMQDYQDGNLAALGQVLATLREILSAIYGINIGDEVIGQAAARYQTRQSIITGRA